MTPRDELEAHEEAYLASLTTAEAEGDERAVEAALRPRTLDEVIGQGAGPRAARAGARGGPPPRPGLRPRAAVRARRASARPRWR